MSVDIVCARRGVGMDTVGVGADPVVVRGCGHKYREV